ncbi:SDR family oxidoreductase [Arachidicoccus terrestris]|uniref:SDR family oxidoreductase n=1 Tax=Arachidicoccus terrestris TaxID=2875539 RepID=UPI001CC72B31|nr:SDR family oxidoreductase [Arachidicoccus terrestris]UAY55410.1 SDR family oxidoreductase [Arachidicoccus terrestris]
MNKILLAGATGYLGGYILKELLRRGFETKALVRNEKKLPQGCLTYPKLDIIKAEVTRPETLKGCCWDVDIVISTVGITRQKDGLTYMDVDYQANLNLLEEAKRSGVKKIIYISVLNADKLMHLKICAAKEKFVAVLKKSGLDYCIIRPTGYFSDMKEFYEMAKKGRVFLFGDGQHRMNPIHGADLAAICVNAIRSGEKELLTGGPQIMTHNQIAKIAFSAALKKPKITHIPNGISKLALFLIRTFTGSKTYGPIEFLMAVLTMDMIAPECGSHTLKEYFEALV